MSDPQAILGQKKGLLITQQIIHIIDHIPWTINISIPVLFYIKNTFILLPTF